MAHEVPSKERKPDFNFITCGVIGIITLLAAANIVAFGGPNILPQEIVQQVSWDNLQGVIAILDVGAVGFGASALTGNFL